MMRSVLAAALMLAMTLAAAPAWAGKSADAANAGLDALNAGDYSRAADLLTQAIKAGDLGPSEREYAYVLRGKAYLDTHKYALAEADFRQALKLTPDDADAKAGLAMAVKAMPAKARAASAPEMAAPTSTHAAELANDGLDALNAGEDERAVRLFTEALETGDLTPSERQYAYYERGQAHLAAQHFDLAQADFKEAVRLKPDDADAQAALNQVANRQNLADVAPMAKPVWLPAPVLDPPTLRDLRPLVLPSRFCSAQQRNDFHASTYVPLKQASNANVAATAAYLERLDILVEKYKADVAYSGLKAEWTRWRAVYDERYAVAQEIGRQFDALMAVPIGCG
jgi:tetratricopeptide (TPR) repeat protein